MDVRDGFGYSAYSELGKNQLSKEVYGEEVRKITERIDRRMILEDLQHRYEGLKERITLVRSYL